MRRFSEEVARKIVRMKGPTFRASRGGYIVKQFRDLGVLTEEDTIALQAACRQVQATNGARVQCEGPAEFPPRVLSCEPGVPDLPTLGELVPAEPEPETIITVAPPEAVVPEAAVTEAETAPKVAIISSDEPLVRTVPCSDPQPRPFERRPDGSSPWGKWPVIVISRGGSVYSR
jgi:hypothetical protein